MIIFWPGQVERDAAVRVSIIALSLLFLMPKAHAEILFEGWSKVLLSGSHVGYTVVRYEHDEKKKEVVVTTFLKVSAAAKSFSEGLKVRARENFRPISYQYTSLEDKKAKLVDATFEVQGEVDLMTARLSEETLNSDSDISSKKSSKGSEKRPRGKVQTYKRRLKKGVFPSSLLAYVMLQAPQGVRVGSNYRYEAIAEEVADVSAGEALVESQKESAYGTLFSIKNSFRGSRFISQMTERGEILSTNQSAQRIETLLVATEKEARGAIALAEKSIIDLFGAIPQGTVNPVSRKDDKNASEKKADDVPAGKGIHTKGGP